MSKFMRLTASLLLAACLSSLVAIVLSIIINKIAEVV